MIGHEEGVELAALNRVVLDALRTDALRRGLARQVFAPAGCTPAELARLVKADSERWADTVKQTGFKVVD